MHIEEHRGAGAEACRDAMDVAAAKSANCNALGRLLAPELTPVLQSANEHIKGGGEAARAERSDDVASAVRCSTRSSATAAASDRCRWITVGRGSRAEKP